MLKRQAILKVIFEQFLSERGKQKRNAEYGCNVYTNGTGSGLSEVPEKGAQGGKRLSGTTGRGIDGMSTCPIEDYREDF